jgi:hypothetical protein
MEQMHGKKPRQETVCPTEGEGERLILVCGSPIPCNRCTRLDRTGFLIHRGFGDDMSLFLRQT